MTFALKSALTTSALAASAFAAAVTFNPLTASASDFKFGIYLDKGQGGYKEVRSRAYGNKQFRRLFDGATPREVRPKHRLHRKLDRFGEPVCVNPQRISRRLHRQGWHDFHDLRIRRRALVFKAVRNNGLIYRLKIDKCSGYLLKANLAWGQYWSNLFSGQDYGYHNRRH